MTSRPNDPVESVIFDALKDACVDFVRENDPRAEFLDFYVPRLDLHIECKQFHSSRTGRQIERSKNIILVVGMSAAQHLASLIRGGAWTEEESET